MGKVVDRRLRVPRIGAQDARIRSAPTPGFDARTLNEQLPGKNAQDSL